MRIFLLIILSALFVAPEIHAQGPAGTATAAGGKFRTNRSRAKWMGANYRKEWNTPITVPVLNLGTEHGGLTPIKRGGGKQTKSLRLEAPNGKQYTIRSITKFITSKTLPGNLQSDAAADLVSDGVSASYPYAALSMAVLSEAAGVPHGNPKVVYIGDDPKLGEYRDDFKNMMVLYEERFPDSVKKGYDTDEVADKLKDDNDNAVDQLAMLRVRILDMFVMDLDRHEDQWNWGAWDNGKGKTFYPIAKDRDQAFYINQGILPGFIKGRSLVPQLEGFKPQAKSIARFNFAARNLDRFFLTSLTEQDWQKEAESFVAKMTDAVIERAIAQQPAEIRDMNGPKIIQTLKDRRNFIVADVMTYYRFLTEIVSVTGSDKTEQYKLTRNDDGSLLLEVYKITKEGAISTKMYERKFEPLQTKEVRIYGFGGDDKFTISGTNDKIKVRMIGGDGADQFENTSKEDDVLVYDRTDGGNTLTGPFRRKLRNDTIVNSFERIYYKYPFQSVFGTLGFTPDDGLFIGPTFKYIRHGFRKSPYKSLHQFKGLFAFSTKALRITYNNEFIGVLGRRTDLTTEIDYRGPNNFTTNFFGYGMNSVYDESKPGQFRFYRVRYDLGDIALFIRHRFSDKVTFSIGPNFQFFHYDSTDKFNKIRNVEVSPPAGLTSSVNQRQSYFGVKAMFMVDTRDNPAMPSKGIFWNTSFRYLAGNKSSYDHISNINTDFSFFLPLAKDWLVWANRTNFGANLVKGMDFEFYQAQSLGNNETLRGYRRERFSGKSAFSNQTELRWKWANLKTYLFPASIGMYAFVDVGRVWVDNDNVSKMATGYGGGIWFSPLRKFVLNAGVGVSSEDMLISAGLFFKF
ncbi:MAG: BamA/TamA family outer membrane protein [Chitinophagaceae bacterium]|mgnify:CR=1 FL=1|nr:BamA/TamA family outer membrane protein [Chitinophagaceae bacterium]